MTCPVCRDTLTISRREGVEIDTCPRCRGVWLHRGELEKIFEREAEPPRVYRHRDADEYKYPRRRAIWRELFD